MINSQLCPGLIYFVYPASVSGLQSMLQNSDTNKLPLVCAGLFLRETHTEGGCGELT